MRRWLFLALLAAILAVGHPPPRAEAHPLGTFTVNQYSRIEVGRDTIHLRYIVDMAEIPALDELMAIDTNRDETVSGAEQAAYLARQTSALVRGLRLTVGGSVADLHVAGQELAFPRAAGSLYTLRLALNLEASLKSAAQPIAVEYRDGNFAERIGWREIVVRPLDGVVLRDSTAPTQDQSDELRAYPQNLFSNPPDVREARFSVTIGVPAAPAMPQLAAAPQPAQNRVTAAPAPPAAPPAAASQPARDRVGDAVSFNYRSLSLLAWAGSLLAMSCSEAHAAGGKGELELQAVDRDTGKPLAVRMHLRDARGKAVRIPKTPYWHDHFVFDGSITLELAPGAYTFEMEHGPEYKVRYGNFQLERDSRDTKVVDLHRAVDMRKEHWYAGDLHLSREPSELDLLMRAEELDVTCDITWWNKKSLWDKQPLSKEPLVRFGTGSVAHLLSGRDERSGASLLLLNLAKPLTLEKAGEEFPGPFQIVQQARDVGGAHIAARSAALWDLPALVAGGQLDSILIAGESLERESVANTPAWEKPRDGSLYPGAPGAGRWSQAIYFHLLNCGLRIPPAAGSGSGLAANPAGYNRVYVHCDEFTTDNWCQGLRAGRSVITNGPLLRPLVNGEPPGQVFQADKGKTVELSIALNLATREKIEYLEVIKDGRVIHETRLDEWAKAGGKLPTVTFERSGWLAIRAVTNATKTYRFALAAPYYVEIGYERSISKQSAQFFLDWLTERARRITLPPGEQRNAIMEPFRQAREFWQEKVAEANVD
jgi:hypothetical protein